MTTSNDFRFVLCIDSSGYPGSLVPRKVYRTVPDDQANRNGLIRIVDESGEDYLYPTGHFVEIDLSDEAKRGFSKTG